ncbi:hypothetical protein H0H81_003362 [Sphagnurus paluster]|uniref:F-box domain-containing protein n=1 Tax=Sphagnurus paluster TaxID=117069 RepID=A0A9P7GQP4_9AGAR|nr:hypothetical protein H0H81_003362 [Sphagnurus paluster]
MALFSGGILRSNLHRVVPPPGAQSAFERWSLVFFTRPGNSVVLRALVEDSKLIADAVASTPEKSFETNSTSSEWFARRIKNQRINNRKFSTFGFMMDALKPPTQPSALKIPQRASKLPRAFSTHPSQELEPAGISRLSTELLAIVFAFSVEARYTDFDKAQPLTLRSPYTLSAVCKRWRDIALADTALWNELFINGIGQQSPGFINAIPIWLGRAQNRPLHLAFHISDDTPTDAIASVLVPFLPKIRKFHVSAPVSFFHALALPYDRGIIRFPLLEEIRFKATTADRTMNQTFERIYKHRINLKGVPKLKKISLESYDISREFTFISMKILHGVPYSQLTSLRLSEHAFTTCDAQVILRACAKLVFCEMTLVPCSSFPLAQRTRYIWLPRLRFLSLLFGVKVGSDETSTEGVARLFEIMRAPELRNVSLSAICDISHTMGAELVRSFMKIIQVSTDIRVLWIKNLPARFEALRPLLALLPRLQILRMNAPLGRTTWGYVHVLHRMEDTFLPRLGVVSITDNMEPRLLDEHGLLRTKVDLSFELGEFMLLDGIKRRLLGDEMGPPWPGSRLVELSVLWRNVPEVWMNNPRMSLYTLDTFRETYDLDIRFPLEVAKLEE